MEILQYFYIEVIESGLRSYSSFYIVYKFFLHILFEVYLLSIL